MPGTDHADDEALLLDEYESEEEDKTSPLNGFVLVTGLWPSITKV